MVLAKAQDIKFHFHCFPSLLPGKVLTLLLFVVDKSFVFFNPTNLANLSEMLLKNKRWHFLTLYFQTNFFSGES